VRGQPKYELFLKHTLSATKTGNTLSAKCMWLDQQNVCDKVSKMYVVRSAKCMWLDQQNVCG
jgi:hypothetical protein